MSQPFESRVNELALRIYQQVWGSTVDLDPEQWGFCRVQAENIIKVSDPNFDTRPENDDYFQHLLKHLKLFSDLTAPESFQALQTIWPKIAILRNSLFSLISTIREDGTVEDWFGNLSDKELSELNELSDLFAQDPVFSEILITAGVMVDPENVVTPLFR